jgi:hypothetical protein
MDTRKDAFKTPGWYYFVLTVLVILGVANSAYLAAGHWSIPTALVTCGLWIAVGTTIANIQRVKGVGPFKRDRR